VKSLEREVFATRSAERQAEAYAERAEANAERAEASAAAAIQRRAVALSALDKLVVEIQEELRDRPGVVAVRERLLREAIRGLSELPREPDARSAVASQTLAEMYFELGGVSLAAPHFEGAIRHADELLRATPDDPEAKHLWCRVRLRLADICMERRKYPRAEELRADVLPFAEAWAAAEPDRPAARYCLLAAREQAAYGEMIGGKLPEARARYEAIRTALAGTPDGADDELAALCARVALHLGVARKAAGAADAAEPALADAQRWRETLLGRRPGSVRRMRDLAIVTDTRREIAVGRGDWPAARDFAERTVQLLTAVVDGNPEYMRYQHDRAVALIQLGKAEALCGNKSGAGRLWGEARTALQRCHKAGRDPEADAALMAELNAYLRALADRK
jgi:hypothetical protein